MRQIRYGFISTLIILSLSLAGCKLADSQSPAPIVDAGTAVGNPTTGSTPPQSGTTVYHTVQAGESLYRISLKYGQDWQDIAKWNNISDPSTLSVGTVLVVSPDRRIPAGDTDSARPDPTTTDSSGIKTVESRMQWAWPATGKLIGRFDGNDNRGIKISGNMGDPVLAAADGRVAYVGDGLRGYGNLVIVKHNDIFVTAYAHNRKILVQENQVVKKGDKIAEMGNSDASQVMLHFEIRQQSSSGSNAVDPLKYLPPK